MVAPAFALANLAGETVTLEELRAAGNPILLLFASAGCGPCTVALTEAGRWQAAHGTAISIVPLILGGADAAQAKATALGLSNVLIQDAEVAPAYGATMPSAVRVKPDGTIGSEVARGPDEIRALFEEMAGIAALPEASSAETASPEPAEAELLSALRQSVEHHAVRPRMADPDPVDSWQEDGLHFFVFRLSRAPGTEESDSPTAVFVMRVDEDEPVSAVVVTPDGNGDPDVIDLRQPNRLDAATV
jgi:hypothetical protein